MTIEQLEQLTNDELNELAGKIHLNCRQIKSVKGKVYLCECGHKINYHRLNYCRSIADAFELLKWGKENGIGFKIDTEYLTVEDYRTHEIFWCKSVDELPKAITLAFCLAFSHDQPDLLK